MPITDKGLSVNLSLWEDDFVLLVSKMVEFQQTATSSTDFYFNRSAWIRSFDSAVDPAHPLEPTNLSLLVFYSLEYLVSKELSDDFRDAKASDMYDELHHIISVVHAKNSDYGNAALSPAILLPWLDVRFGLLVRLSDKIQRLYKLYNAEKTEVNESLEDTLRDIVGYIFLIYATVRTVGISGKEENAGEGGTV